MRNLTSFAACVAFGLTTASAVVGTPAKTGSLRFTGIVETVDAANRTLAVRGKDGKTRQFSTSDATIFTKGGKRSKIAPQDIRKGEKVTVTHVGAEATHVHVKVPRSKKKTSRKNTP